MTQAEKRLEESMQILAELGFTGRHSNKLAGYVLLALLDLHPNTAWSEAQNPLRGVTPIIDFVNKNYSPAHYAPNTRESVRDEAVRPLVDAGMVLRNPDNLSRATTSGKTVYQVSEGALTFLKHFGSQIWSTELETFKATLNFKPKTGDSQQYGDERLASVLFPQDDRLEDQAESILQVPPEQRKLITESYDFSISTIVDYFTKGSIYVPVYQRNYVWSQSQASRLIESLIIQCPIPVIYLNQEPDESLSVIDGNQRINSISSYIRGAFQLKGLTSYPELEGLRFGELDVRFQRHILNRTLRCIVIRKDTHSQVKFDVFERLNSGAVGLNAQELRHGIYHGPFMNFVELLSKTLAWRSLLRVRNEKRMKGEEFVIRFFALNEQWKTYQKPLFAFLNKYCEQNRFITDERAEKLRESFTIAVENCREIFNDAAFQIKTESGMVQSAFNAALFDAQMAACASLGAKIKLTQSKRKQFLKEFGALMGNDEFFRAISRATSDEQAVKFRISEAIELFAKLSHA